jgi:two-component system cell cycle sensor histidine kinase/response regulator CckA
MKSPVMEELPIVKTTTPLRVLLVEQSSHDIELILFELRDSGFQVEPTVVETRDDFHRALKNQSFDAVLADNLLPGWSGLDVFANLRAAGLDIPFLLVTGNLGEEAAVDCIKQGVSDCVLKNRMKRLPLALHRALRDKALRDENQSASEALRVSETRNRALIEHAACGIACVSGDGALLAANPALRHMLGSPADQGVGTLNLARDLFRFPEQYVRLMAAYREFGQVQGTEAEWKRADGAILAVRLHLRRLCLDEDPDAFEMIAEDVTELRALERQLRQAQKFEAIGQLAGGVAHDFNNVVGAILGWAEIGLEHSHDNIEMAERFNRIREQANRAAALIRELLAFARPQVLQPRPVDLNIVANGLHSLLDKVIDKSIEMKFLTTPLDPVKGDPTQLEQILMNLCVNARDAMPKGGQLVVETEMVELDEPYCRFYPYVTPGRYAVLSVSDTGEGMDPGTRERIFEPFFTTKENGQGTGMGLATVYGIVKQHGGFIHVYTEPSHGSLFRVYLPAMEGGISHGAAAKSTVPSRAELRGTETILLAEDHESIREMARQTLVSLGYRVLSAADGEEALQLVEHDRPSLAILDVVMPKKGGPAVAGQLALRYSGVRIVLTSGYSAESDMVPEGAKGRYLQKPYSPTTLARLVREILDEK